MKEAKITVPERNMLPGLKNVRPFRIPVKVPRYYKKRIKVIKRGLL